MKYDYWDTFRNGFAVAKIGEKWGLIDQDFNQIVSPKYDFAWPLCDGVSRVKLGDKWGQVDISGNETF